MDYPKVNLYQNELWHTWPKTVTHFSVILTVSRSPLMKVFKTRANAGHSAKELSGTSTVKPIRSAGL